MQKYFLVFMLPILASVAADPAPAVAAVTDRNPVDPVASKPAVIKESDRLMQEYMAQRAKWIALRRTAGKQAEAAKTPAERTRILDKLQTDERALRAAADDARQRYRAAVDPARRIVTAEKPGKAN